MADVGLLGFYFSNGLVRVCEISHMGKNNGNPDLVCEKNVYCTLFNRQARKVQGSF